MSMAMTMLHNDQVYQMIGNRGIEPSIFGEIGGRY
jgi:hypothetical protein